MSHAIHKIVSIKRCQSYFISRRSPHLGISKDSESCASAHRCLHYAYARLCFRNFPFTLMERKGISIFDNTDHGLAGIEDDLVPVVIVISGGTVIGSLLPIHMYSSAIGEEPAVPGGVMTLKSQIPLAQFLVKRILYQNIFESQLLSGGGIYMRAVCAAGQMLGTVIEAVILVKFKITPCQRITPGHIDIGGILCFGTVLPKGVRFRLGGKPEMILIAESAVSQAVALFLDHLLQTFTGSISIVGLVTVGSTEKGSLITAGGTVYILSIRLRQQLIDEKRTAEMYDKSIPF